MDFFSVLRSNKLLADKFLAGSDKWLWILGDVRMFWTRVNLQLVHHVPSELILWHHASDRMKDQIFRLASLAIRVAFEPQPGVAGVPSEVPYIHLITGHRHLIRVNHDDKVATIDVGCVLRAMLAHQYHGNITSQSTQDFILSIDEHPLFFDVADVGDIGSLCNHLGWDRSKKAMCLVTDSKI